MEQAVVTSVGDKAVRTAAGEESENAALIERRLRLYVHWEI